MKTVQELKNRWWYRLTKILYFLITIVICVFGVIITFDSVGNYTTDFTITCNYGNKSTFLALKDKGIAIYNDLNFGAPIISPTELSNTTKENLQKACEISSEEMNSKFDRILNGTDDGTTLFDLTETKVLVDTYLSASLWSILFMFIVFIIAEIIRRAFYYVILGSIRPPKK